MAAKISKSQLVTYSDPESVATEAYKILRTNLMMRDFEGKIKVLNVLSANAQEAKSTTVLNLAYVFSQIGKKVLVIDLDLRLSTVHKKLGIRNDCGITDVITRHMAMEDVVVHVSKNFDVLTSGTKIPFAAEFIQSAALKNFINQMKEIYDLILIDCPPVNLVADGMIAAKYCDGTLMCVASGADERSDLIKAKELLEQNQINVLGIVMTRVPVAKKYYSYKYKYGYGHQPESRKKAPFSFLRRNHG